MGSQVLVPFRGSEDSPRHLKLMGDLGKIVPMKYNPRDESSIKAVMAKANVVINLIGRDYATKNISIEEVNQHMEVQIFQATIMKPAILIDTKDRIMNKWAHFTKKYDFITLYGDGSTKIQPAFVVDMGKVYELRGQDIFTVHESAVATPREFFVNKFPFALPTPEMINLDEINVLTQDTIVSKKALTFEVLGIVPYKLKGYPIEFLISYRKGGPEFGSTVSEKVSPEDFP